MLSNDLTAKSIMSSENYFIKDQYATYFLTFTIVDWVDVFTRSQYKNAIVDSLSFVTILLRSEDQLMGH